MSQTSRSALSHPRWSPARYRHYAMLPLRLVVGYGFAAHGWAKLLRGPEAFVAILAHLGMPLPHFLGWLTILVELAGGLAVLAGVFTLLASVPLAIIMLVAMFSVHLPFGFSSIKLQAVTAAGPQFGPVGYEVNLLYLAILASLALRGAGPWSVDALRKRSGAQAGAQSQARRLSPWIDANS